MSRYGSDYFFISFIMSYLFEIMAVITLPHLSFKSVP